LGVQHWKIGESYVILHIFYLHAWGSNNPLGSDFGSDGGLTFSPYYLVKDLNGLIAFLGCFVVFLYFSPDLLGHPDNYIKANPLITPTHIVPEWYFLPFYAILRSIPEKLFGVFMLVFALICLYYVPLMHFPQTRVVRYRPFGKIAFWYLVITCFVLGWVGGMPIEDPYLHIGQIATLAYFAYFIIIAPFAMWLDKYIWFKVYRPH